MSARAKIVIEAKEQEGRGIEGDPSRIVYRYYELDGKFLAERDRWKETQNKENH